VALHSQHEADNIEREKQRASDEYPDQEVHVTAFAGLARRVGYPVSGMPRLIKARLADAPTYRFSTRMGTQVRRV
jgi:hypothetical protein